MDVCQESRKNQEQVPSKDLRPTSPSSIQITEDYIAEHSLEITQAISLKENLGNWAQALATAKDEARHAQVKKEIQQVSGCLNSLLVKLGIPLFKLPKNVRKLNLICERVRIKNAPSAASNLGKSNEKSKVKSTPKRKIDLSCNSNKNVNSTKGSPAKESKKRVADEDGLIAPAAHLIRKVKNLKINNDKNYEENKTKKVLEGIEEVALNDKIGAALQPAQPKQRRMPPIFVNPRADFRMILNILKFEAPFLHPVMSNTFLKITVETKEENRSLSNLLETQGAEFKTFMLKTDRPIKVVLQGLPSCTPIEETKEELQKEGFAVVSTTQLSKFQSKSPMPLFYEPIANGPLSETVYTSLKCLARKFQWSDTEE
ncbi:hypothetical protein HNY73_015638 [Argiope bruennichi]|uniref:Uncharacterized protein n=1 Tax=Argiope bruennichi TaxID=94029 RepID=A0A8T0EUP1_ARGBR|nr:hypothetical protein HNY73_015638 [Argiope bruennichi]